ncbi:hypothetical protein [Anaerotruncus massiliensis (ex Togo et al. 2019)]|uniref:hypothetical protein n=1 Tax=Anaerotruncus massiliensis (ex Togo et al. 2019) TaxID=1673720 RepID=UPI00208D89D5|nr:hypothetical protein [Anaerotruncus massiliensis (ex Togo et al. 2019)]GKH47092.1 hypothetical protein CE91St45_16540 [Oscillospiraceae bacterium]
MGKTIKFPREGRRKAAAAEPPTPPRYPPAYDERSICELPALNAELWDYLGEISPPRRGACRYCGQVREGLSENLYLRSDLDEAATCMCGCAEARAYVSRKRGEEERVIRRKSALELAEDTVDMLFGEDAPGRGALPMNADVRRCILDAAMLVYDGRMRSANITVIPGVKVKITKSTKDVLYIERSDSASWKEEVNG